MTTEIDIEAIAAQVRRAHDEAERRIAGLRDERERINTEIKLTLAQLKQINRMNKAVTPPDENGPDE